MTRRTMTILAAVALIGLAAAGRLGSIGTDWELLASGAVATANDGAFSNTEAIYPVATIEAVHTRHHPVKAEIAALWQHERLRIGLHEVFALGLGKAEAHERLVARERHVDDLADAELDPVAHEYLVRARQARREGPHLLDGRGRLRRS